MTSDYCRIPEPAGEREAAIVKRLLQAHRIVVVGASDDPSRPGNYVPQYLQSAGKQIVPVNPKHEVVLGEKCYPSLADIPGPVDLVNVFRRPGACADVVRQAIAIGAKGVWLQSGIMNEEARCLAEEAGLDFVQDRCIMVELRRLG